MQKQTTPEVPQGLTPALNAFLRWVRDQIKGQSANAVKSEERIAMLERKISALESAITAQNTD